MERSNSNQGQRKEVTDDLEHIIYSEMERKCPSQTFDNVFGVEKCNDMLIENIVQPFRFPHLYTKPMRAFTLFGVAGCGKSHLLAAAANASGAKLFVFNVWNLKNCRIFNGTSSSEVLKTAFKVTRDNSPSILCFEDLEVFSRDDMCAARAGFMSEMQTFLHSSQDVWDLVVVIGVTQVPWKVDPSVREIFTWSSSCHVPLPDADARVQMMEATFHDISHMLSHEEFTQLATRTSGYTGSDLICLAKGAAMLALRQLSTVTHFKKVSDATDNPASNCSGDNTAANTTATTYDAREDSNNDSCTNKEGNDTVGSDGEASLKADNDCGFHYLPCDSDDPNAIPVSVCDLPADLVKIRPVNLSDVEEQLGKMSPSVNAEEVGRLERFQLE